MTLGYACFLFYLSSLSIPPEPPDIHLFFGIVSVLEDLGMKFLVIPFYIAYRNPDKVAHFFLYMIFGFFLHPTISTSGNSVLSKYAAPLSIFIGSIYGLSDEFHQSFVPYRSASMLDFLADFFGLLFSQILIFSYFGIKRIKRLRGGMEREEEEEEKALEV
ncbi:MAG: VanZ family protein [Methanophagales archaeon]|nr:VanZ family protein [Methanophagales archaeon]